MKLLVVIPAYNEAGNIEKTILDLREYFANADYLVINDCSTDDTLDILKRLNVKYIDLPINLGIGGAVQTGFKYAKEHNYDIAIQFDGDGQHDAKYLNNLIEPLINCTANGTIGSRFVNNQGFQSTALRRIGINYFSFLVKSICHFEIKDATSGMRACDRKLIDLFSESYAQDFPEPEAIVQAGLNGATLVEVPVEMRERLAGKSSINAMGSIYYMIKVTLALILTKIKYKR